MSGSYNRNIMPLPRNKLKVDTHLPEIISNYSATDTGRTGRAFYTYTNSAVSSAHSHRFLELFYRHHNEWPSLSDTETCDSPECAEFEGSDSSASSVFSWADTEGTRRVYEEWEKIQRTLYDEDGPKVTHQHLIDECNQWKEIFPHLRIVGRSFSLTDSKFDDMCDTEEEVLALDYDSDADSSIFNEQKNTLDYKKNSADNIVKYNNIKSKKKSSAKDLVEGLNTILHISPITYDLYGRKHTPWKSRMSSIIKSEVTSSRWRHKSRESPEFVSLPYQSTCETGINVRDSSASSLFPKNKPSGNILWGTFNKNNKQNEPVDQQIYNGEKFHLLEPIEAGVKKSFVLQDSSDIKSASVKSKNVSLPPLNCNESKTSRRSSHGAGNSLSGKANRKNKKTLTPLDITTNIPKHNIKIDADALSLFQSKSALSKSKTKKKK